MASRILIIDGDDGLRESLQMLLVAEGHDVVSAANTPAALTQIEDACYEAIFCEAGMLALDGTELLPQLVGRLPDSAIILMSGPGSGDLAEKALDSGAYDYIEKPYRPSEVLLSVRRAEERGRSRRSKQLLQRDVLRTVGEQPIVATTPAMIELLELMERVAVYKSTVFMTGEPGTGKEVLARAIHAQSPRRREEFVAVDCAAMTASRLESELFGHASGAVAGAERPLRGMFVESHGGTLFLDEIGELPVGLQVKMLRVLQDEEIWPLGAGKPVPVDVRVIAATSRDIEEDVREGRFREDLFYRLNVVRLEVPPLRERPRDVPLLMDHFISQLRGVLGKPLRSISDAAVELLMNYRWPGNVRELKNVVERAAILCDGERITPREIPESVRSPEERAPGADLPDLCLKRARKVVEADLIRRALQATGGNRTHAAKLLEISHRAILYKIKEFCIRD